MFRDTDITDREDHEVGWDDDMSRYDGDDYGDDRSGGGADDDTRRLLAEVPPHHSSHF